MLDLSHPAGVTSGSGGSPLLDLCTEDVAIARSRNIMVVEWRKRTTAAAARDLSRRMRSLARAYPKGVFYLALVSEQAPPPDSEARRALAEMLKNGAQSILAGAVVMDGNGLRSSFVRGVATGLAMLARPAFPFSVCTLERASELFAERAGSYGQSFDRARMLRDLSLIRAAIEKELHTKWCTEVSFPGEHRQ